MQVEGRERLAQYLKQVECGKRERKLTAKHCTAKSTSRQEANAKCEPSAMQVNTLGIYTISPCSDALAAPGTHYSEQSAISRRDRRRNQQTETDKKACGYCRNRLSD